VAIDLVAPGPGGRPGPPVLLGAGLALVAVAAALGREMADQPGR
jgi:hypothetical protein